VIDFQEFKGLDRNINDFYYWGFSSLWTNTVRAVIAEYIVACTLGLDKKKRNLWGGYDFEYMDTRIEVKSSAWFVTDKYKTNSKMFDIEKRKGSWHLETGKLLDLTGEKARQAHIYVFAFHDEKDFDRANLLELDQWQFFVVPTPLIDARLGNQKKVSRNVIARKLGVNSVPFAALRREIDRLCEQRLSR